MSEYQYYEFCNINTPLTADVRKKMASLSSRAQVGTHSASYVYNYGDFRGNPKQLLIDNFDVFFYINNWGTLRLMFKYPRQCVDIHELKPYCINPTISCEQIDDTIILDIYINHEEGGGWIEGEGILPELLPLYDEIKTKNYQLLNILSAHERPHGSKASSSAQDAFLNHAGLC